MLIGYARVSTQGQNLDRQIEALRVAGCDRIFAEKASAKTLKARPELEKAISALNVNDVLVLAEWCRATRSMYDGIAIMQRVAKKAATIKVLDKPHLDLTTPVGQGLLAFLSAIAQDERERILKRAAEGRRHAVKKGGPHFKITDPAKVARIKERLAQGESERSIAADFGVGRSTIGRIRNR